MNYDKMLQWIGTHRVGVSSRTMWNALMGIDQSARPDDYFASSGLQHIPDIPYDSDDFSRCLDLVTFAEVTREELELIPERLPFFRPIIDIWDEVVEAMRNKDHKEAYYLLYSKRNEVMELQGRVAESTMFYPEGQQQ